jgi:predicted amidohydrolase
VKVALGQLASGGDKEHNLRAVGELTRRAAGAGAQLVVFPEEAMYATPTPDQPLAAAAETLDGPFTTKVRELASELSVTLAAGIYEQVPEDDERVYNTIVVAEPSGELSSYRKLHLFDAFGNRESDRIVQGDGGPFTFDVDGTRVGLLNCYDIRFPELARLLIDDGAELLVVCASWVDGRLKEDHWETLLRARAIENTCWVAAANQCTDITVGRSMLIDPMGVVCAALGEQREDLVSGEVDGARTSEVRRLLPSINNRRFMVSANASTNGHVQAKEEARS